MTHNELHSQNCSRSTNMNCNDHCARMRCCAVSKLDKQPVFTKTSKLLPFRRCLYRFKGHDMREIGTKTDQYVACYRHSSKLLTAIKLDEMRGLSGQHLYDCFSVSFCVLFPSTPLVTNFFRCFEWDKVRKIIDDIHKERSNSAFVCLTQLKPFPTLCNIWTFYMENSLRTLHRRMDASQEDAAFKNKVASYIY